MKNILFILIVCLMVTMVNAAPNGAASTLSRRDEMIQLYAPKSASNGPEALLTAAKNGDVARINTLGEQARRADFFLATDKFGNNVFHLAKDAQTIQVIAYWIRQNDKNFASTISQLRNQRNQFGETPLMAHINYGKADTFMLLYTGSDLEQSVRDANSVNKGGALNAAATIKIGIARSKATSGGRTVADAARANIQMPGMDKVVVFFEKHAPYLFAN